jgi:Tfp pilus assembly protein PilF
MSKFDGPFREATRMRDQGAFPEAIEILTKLAREPDAPAGVFGMLGHIQQQAGRLEDATVSFRRATQLAPRTELASLGLFHTLWERGLTDEAFEEIKRFQMLADSADYREIVAEVLERSKTRTDPQSPTSENEPGDKSN